MPNCLDRSLEGVEWDIVGSTDIEPSNAVEFGYVDSFVEATKLIFGADYTSCTAICLIIALA